MKQNIVEKINNFQLEGKFVQAIPYGTGHVNDTFLVECRKNQQVVRYILQRINHFIFTNPKQVMENIQRVTAHIRQKLQMSGAPDIDRRTLTVIPTKDGQNCFQDKQGCYWRLYRHIENARTWDYLNCPYQAYEAARMFGWFQRMLADWPLPKLHETIPDFHNTPKRLKVFLDILEKDPRNRASQANKEIQFVLEHSPICAGLVNLLKKGLICERITHNDTKINNVLFDMETDQGICVIDLDTVMPGLSLYDFGDMVRTATCQAAEDEQDLSKIEVDLVFYEQIVRGYAHETADILTQTEKEYLAFAAKLITFEQMIRFLGDFLNGDVYYKIHRPMHNLDRARTQMKLIQSILTKEQHINEFVETIWKTLG
jgi:thiamine kinase-like enzyme